MSDIGGVLEIADALDVEPSTVRAWVLRYPDFPQPVARVSGREAYVIPDVVAWATARGLPSEAHRRGRRESTR